MGHYRAVDFVDCGNLFCHVKGSWLYFLHRMQNFLQVPAKTNYIQFSHWTIFTFAMKDSDCKSMIADTISYFMKMIFADYPQDYTA